MQFTILYHFISLPVVTASLWLKCKIRGGGKLHSGLGPWQWSCAFP